VATILQDLASVGTFLTAIAALFTILEMRRQRRSGYQPTLAIRDELVDLQLQSRGNLGHEVIFQPVGSSLRSTASDIVPLKLYLQNVGAGSALEVEAQWRFDGLEFANAIAQIDSDVGRSISIENDFVRFDGKGAWGARYVQTHHVGTMSVSSPPIAVEVPFPFAYAALSSTFFEALLAKGKFDTAFDLPPLSLEIKFRDRTGKRGEAQFSISFQLIYIAAVRPELAPGESRNIGSGIFTARAA